MDIKRQDSCIKEVKKKILNMSLFFLNKLLRIVLFAFISFQSNPCLIILYKISFSSLLASSWFYHDTDKQGSFYGHSNFMSPIDTVLVDVSIEVQDVAKKTDG